MRAWALRGGQLQNPGAWPLTPAPAPAPPHPAPPHSPRSPDSLNLVWRLSYGIGLIPIAFMLFWRIFMLKASTGCAPYRDGLMWRTCMWPPAHPLARAHDTLHCTSVNCSRAPSTRPRVRAGVQGVDPQALLPQVSG